MAGPVGNVYLCRNAIIDNTYSNTIDFRNASEQLAYWRSLVKFTITDFSYIRRTQQFIRVNKNIEQLTDVNYLYFQNEQGKLYYCFVTSKEYKDDSTTYIYFETDVMQTYMFDYSIKQSYVLQEHVDRWTAGKMPIFSLTDEGLDYGNEYTTESAYRIRGKFDIDWYLAIIKPGFTFSSGENTSEPTRSYTTAIPYLYYLIPNVYGNNLPEVVTMLGDTSTHITTVKRFMNLMSGPLGTGHVQQVIKLPYLPLDFEYQYIDTNVIALNIPSSISNMFGITEVEVEGSTIKANLLKIKDIDQLSSMVNNRYVYKHKKLAELDLYAGIENAMPTAQQWAEVKNNPYNTPRDKRFESKLLTYPYRFNILTDWKNQPILIKNEYIGASKIKVDYLQALTNNAPARYWVEGYRKDVEGRYNSLVQVVQEDVPVLNDAYYSYMLQNRNQLHADRTNALVSIAGGVIGGGVQGAISGGMIGGPAGAVGGAIQGTLGNAFQGAVNYQNLIRGQNAKQKDLRNMPDSIVSGNDIAFTNQDNNQFLSFYRQKICCEFEELLADTFAMTGYTVKRIKIPNLRSRVRFNYIKTIGANITGSFNQEDVIKIKAIFDNGITFWHYNAVNFKPFDYSLENIETSLL